MGVYECATAGRDFHLKSAESILRIEEEEGACTEIRVDATSSFGRKRGERTTGVVNQPDLICVLFMVFIKEVGIVDTGQTHGERAENFRLGRAAMGKERLGGGMEVG